MGLRQALRLNRASTGNGPVVPQISSPWQTGDLSSIVWADLLDAEWMPVTRGEAMGVPAYARARHLLAGAVAGCPLVEVADDVPTPDQPAWLNRSDGSVSTYHRMLWTLDDLLFSGWSLWVVDRVDGLVTGADRVPAELWQFGTDQTVMIDGTPARAADVVLIPGPHEGIVNYAQRSIRAAAKLERAAARHASNPVPSVELHQEQDIDITAAERDELVQSWITARSGEGGAVGFTSYGVRAYAMGQVPEQLLVEGRNAAAVDAARNVSVPAAMLDATNAGASLTYETTEGRSGQFLDYGVALYLDAIAARLSLDDVVAPGRAVRFDTSRMTALSREATTTGPTEE